MNNETQIRRVFLPADVEEIRRLQQNAPEFARHYPRHNDWLSMALNEVMQGKRFAFGIFKSMFDEHYNATVSLIGSIILKKEEYSHIMQLKNLFIKPEERRHDYGTHLFNTIEQFCIKRGSIAIETEVPYVEKGTINFLTSQGFEVQHTIESPYLRGDRLYKMYKRLPIKYIGDPFDLLNLTCWLFETGYSFTILNSKDLKVNFISEPTFDFEPNFETNRELGAMGIRGSALVIDGVGTQEIIQEFYNRNKNHILIVVARVFDEAARKYCDRVRIKIFDQATIEKELRSAFAVEIPDFSKEEIGGIIVPMNAKYLDVVKNGDSIRTFFKGGPIGKYLRAGNLALLYIEENSRFTNGGVKVFGEITKCEVDSPDRIWKRFSHYNPIFPKDDYMTWSADKSEIVAFTVSNIVGIETIPLYRIHTDITERKFDSEQLGHFYLSKTQANKFLEVKKDLNPSINSINSRISSQEGAIFMGPLEVISAVSSGLNIIDKFRNIAIKDSKKPNKSTSLQAVQKDDVLEITKNNQVAQSISASNLQMGSWDDVRYKALQKSIDRNWGQYNALYERLPTLSVDERVRIEQRMEDMKRELCRDFNEMIALYEATLAVPLLDYYSIVDICP